MINVTRRQFMGIPMPGVLHQKAQCVEAPERGISFRRPERFVVNTPVGQIEIGNGDWILDLPNGSRYVVRNKDVNAVTPQGRKKWWHLW